MTLQSSLFCEFNVGPFEPFLLYSILSQDKFVLVGYKTSKAIQTEKGD